MLLAIDSGNSRVKFGIFDGSDLIERSAADTGWDVETFQIGQVFGETIASRISRIVVCTVVPHFDAAFLTMAEKLNVPISFAGPESDLGISIKYDPPQSLGVDRMMAASAAFRLFGGPCIVCSFGTATTIDAVDADGVFRGGSIAPGLRMMTEALGRGTAKLPIVEIHPPANVIGDSTVEAIRSGVFYGHIGIVEGIISRIKTVLEMDAMVVATGGFAGITSKHTDILDVVDEALVLKGLAMLGSFGEDQF